RRRPGRGPGPEVHALLRPALRRHGAGVRPGLPHPVDPVRRPRRAAPAGPGTAGHAGGVRRGAGPARRARPGRRGRRHRGVLPAARRARGLRPAARSGGHHQGPAGHVAPGGAGGRHPAGRRGRGVPDRKGGPAVTEPDLRRRTSGGKRRRRRGRGEQAMVPDAEFTSYYGRPVVKASPWEADIPAYLFLGGLAGGSSLLAAGADLTELPRQRRSARLIASGAIAGSLFALIHDLGRPARFHHMLRVAKPTSPMSVGTWILSAYGPFNGLATSGEALAWMPEPVRCSAIGRLLGRTARPGGLVAALIAPAVASYTAVLLTDTATPGWHEAKRELPFVVVGSAAAASGGMGPGAGPPEQSGP